MDLLQLIKNEFAELGIEIIIVHKAVKNINYRITLGKVYISCPPSVNDTFLAQLLINKKNQLISHHHRLTTHSTPASIPNTLWGQPYRFESPKHRLDSYRFELSKKLPELQSKWQPIVGKTANEVKIKKMYTRFGTCNTAKARIWLSVYLSAFDYQCAEYVFVHELCHLHYANHSQNFWQCVRQAMPDYYHWHKLLQQQGLRQFVD